MTEARTNAKLVARKTSNREAEIQVAIAVEAVIQVAEATEAVIQTLSHSSQTTQMSSQTKLNAKLPKMC